MISFNAVTKQQGTRILFSNASFQLNPGDKIGLVGPNGAGKNWPIWVWHSFSKKIL